MRTVGLVAPHFVPSGMTCMHRIRLWSLHLREFGWDPVVISTHWSHYEEPPQLDLLHLLPPDLRVVRTAALPTRPLRLVGDIGVRALPWHYRAISKLAARGALDFLHISIPSNFSACLGPLVWRRHRLPYGIDYQDPWVHEYPGSRKPLTRAWASARLAELLEPWVVRHASLITGINRRYYQGMLDRNPAVERQAVLAEMPLGGAELDHAWAEAHPRPTPLFDAHPGKFDVIYAGAMLPNAGAVLERFLEGLCRLRAGRPDVAARLRLHFVGTGRSPLDPQGFNVRPRAERAGVADLVSETPQRLPYLDVLAHLHAASAVLIVGSTDRHYSPSKVFQALMSRRPVLAMLHPDCEAAALLREVEGTCVIPVSEDALPSAADIADALARLVDAPPALRPTASLPEAHTARASARRLAEALDEAMERQPSSRRTTVPGQESQTG